MSHQNKPPTGSPLHTATNQPSAFRHIHSPPPIQLPANANAAINPAQLSPSSAGATAAAMQMQARATQMPMAAVASGQAATPASPASGHSYARVTPAASRSPAAQPAHVLPLQLQTKVLRQTPGSRSSPITAAAAYQLPTYSSPATGHHSRMLSASSANAMLMLQQQQLQQQQQSQQSNLPSARKTSSVTAPPTPSPPQSERNSPATVMGAREQQQQQQQQAPSSQPSSQLAALAAYPLSHSFPVLLPPPQFSTIAPFLFRCGRFHVDTHGSFLRDLHLRSIVYLSNPLEHPLSSSIKNWAAEQGVEIVNIGAAVFGSAPVSSPDSGSSGGGGGGSVAEQDWHHSVPGSSSASFLSLYSELVRLALEHLLLASNSPVLLMCHNGIELCSLVVGCLRRLQRWTYTSLLDEFTRSTSAMQLRDPRSSAAGQGGPGSSRGAHHHHKSDLTGPSGSATASGPGGASASSESVWIAGTACIRYAAAACNSTDLHRHYRLEELMELFDLNSVRIPELGPRKRADSSAVGSASSAAAAPGSSSAAPPVSLCVEWYRKQRALERREHRSQKQARQMRLMQQLHNVLAAQADAATSADKTLEPHQEEKTAPVPAAVAAVPSLCSWSSDLFATYHSNRLLSSGLRFDKKATLVDEDED